MKSYTLIAFIFIYIFSFNCATSFAQVTEEYSFTPAEKESYLALKQRIENYEKEVLKSQVQTINEQLESGKITADESTQLKVEASQKAAQNIQELNEIVDTYTSYLKRNFEDVEIDYSTMDFSELDLELPLDDLTEALQDIANFFETIKDDTSMEANELKEKRALVRQKREELLKAREELRAMRNSGIEAEVTKLKAARDTIRYEPKTTKRTEGHFIFAIGFNNAVASAGSINDTEYRFGGSRSFEIGLARSTRVFENTNWLRLVYGFSFQFNGLKPSGNRIFVNNDGVTELQEFEFNLEKNKFRMDNLIVPVHFQLGSSTTKSFDNGAKHFGPHEFKFGIGGFVGINLTSLQKLKYNNENGRNVKDKLKSGYNTSNILYGLSTYFGWENFAFYAQYNLNPIFKNNPVDEYNFQLGVRYNWF